MLLLYTSFNGNGQGFQGACTLKMPPRWARTMGVVHSDNPSFKDGVNSSLPSIPILLNFFFHTPENELFIYGHCSVVRLQLKPCVVLTTSNRPLHLLQPGTQEKLVSCFCTLEV